MNNTQRRLKELEKQMQLGTTEPTKQEVVNIVTGLLYQDYVTLEEVEDGASSPIDNFLTSVTIWEKNLGLTEFNKRFRNKKHSSTTSIPSKYMLSVQIAEKKEREAETNRREKQSKWQGRPKPPVTQENSI